MVPRRSLVRARDYGCLLAMGLALLLPFVAFALSAFSRQWYFPQLLPETWSLQAWRLVLGGRSRVGEALYNSTVLAFAVTLASILIALPAARALGMYTFRGKRIVEFLVLAPIMVPPLTVGMGLSVNFIRLGLAGTLLGVGLVYLVPVLPYVVLTLSGVFASYDVAYEEQARTLGAGRLAVLWHVTLPLIYPGIVVSGLFAFLISWSQYILTFLIGGGRVITMPVLLFSSIPGGDNASIAAQALLFVAPSVLILVFTSRYLSGRGHAVQGFGRI